MEEEIFVDIKGYEGLYQISNFGNVKSLGNEKKRKEKIIKQGQSKKGYLFVNLYKNGKGKIYQVHRLVAIAFIENPNNFLQVNHKDEDKTNNVVENLEWCDAKYNNNYGSRITKSVANTDWKIKVANTDYKAIAEKLTNGVLSKQVYQYSLDLNLIKIWQSTKECKRNGFNQGNISECCNGKRKSHKGYIWSYTEILKDG